MLKVWYGRNLSSNIGNFKVKELKLPVIKVPHREAKILSMDEYLGFVQFNLKNAFDKKAYQEWKRMLMVDAPFAIKD